MLRTRNAVLFALLLSSALTALHAQSTITAAEALSPPFMNQLTAAPAKNRVAWFIDDEGRRNIWVASPTEKARAITHNTQDDGEDISDITWSPDAEAVAYTHGTGPDGSAHPTAANPTHSQEDIQQRIELATLSGNIRVIGEGHAPTFSTDGKRIFFLEHGHIMACNLTDENAKPQQLIQARGTASQLRPSPDGTKLAFVSKRDDHSFIGIFNLTTRTLTYADPGTGLDHDPAWSPDSKHIAFIRDSPVATELNLRWMRSGVPWAIRIADTTTGEGIEAWHADPGKGSLFHEITAKNQLLWMKDNRLIFPWEKTGWVHLYSIAPGGKVAKDLTPGEGEVDNVVSDKVRLAYSSNIVNGGPSDLDRRHVATLSTDDAPPEILGDDELQQVGPAILTDGRIAAMQSSYDRPFRPVILPTYQAVHACRKTIEACLADSTTQLAGGWSFPAGHFVEPQPIIFTSADGTKIHAQLFLPKDTRPGAKLPAVVFFHGGSRQQMLLGFHRSQYYTQTYEFNQLLAAHGYAVLSVNYRSGTGYGMEFRQAQHYGVFGGSEYADVKGAALYLQSRPDIDPKRIGAWGGSYGGYLTALALARNSDLFAAGVDFAGVHDYAMEMELEKPNSDHTVNTRAMEHTAWLASPMADIGKWKSPVLLIQGDDDRDVMFSNTVRLAAALREHGVHVEEKIFPDEVHDFLLHRDWVASYAAALDFFDRMLKPESPRK